MKRLLVVLEQGDRLPSGYIRGLIYRDLLAREGFVTTFVERQAPPPRRRLRAAGNRLQRIATTVRERRILRLAPRADVIYLSKVLSLDFIRALRRASAARIVLDICDAVWLMDGVVAVDIQELFRSVDAITTDNEITAAYVRRFNPRCAIVPDPAQVEAFDARRGQRRKPDERIVLGWLGSPHTAFNLYVVWEALEELFRRHPAVHLRLVGTGPDARFIPPFERARVSCLVEYTSDQMIDEVLGMHVGLFPLQDVEICRSRGINKATIYMSGEAVVMASSVGQCRDFIQDGLNGFIASSTAEWVEKLDQLVRDESLRKRLAAGGLAAVRAQFSVDHCFARLRSVLEPSGEVAELT